MPFAQRLGLGVPFSRGVHSTLASWFGQEEECRHQLVPDRRGSPCRYLHVRTKGNLVAITRAGLEDPNDLNLKKRAGIGIPSPPTWVRQQPAPVLSSLAGELPEAQYPPQRVPLRATPCSQCSTVFSISPGTLQSTMYRKAIIFDRILSSSM